MTDTTEETTLYEGSMETAETKAFEVLCNALKLERGVKAHRGLNPNKVDVLVFGIGTVQSGDVVLARNATKFHFGAWAQLWFRDRAELQKLIMRAIKNTPFEVGGNVLNFRLSQNGVGAIMPTAIPVNPEQEPVPCYTVTLDFDIVFQSGDKKRD